MQVPLSSPDIGELEIRSVNEVLRSGRLSLGPKLRDFERKFAEYIGSRFAVGASSGTGGLHLCLIGIGIGPGDELITSPFSFVASSNCILMARGKPVFVDVDPLTLNMDPSRIEEAITERTKAILPVHIFGHPCDMDAIMELSQEHSLEVVEDACEATGAKYGDKLVGSFGRAGVFAFYPNKQMTMGEGGVVVTDDEALARLLRSLGNQGRSENGSWLEHERLGFNYRLDEMSSALGLAQLERIDELLSKRDEAAQKYNQNLKDVEEVGTQYVAKGVKISWFVYVIRLSTNVDREGIMRDLRADGVESRPYFSPIHLQPFYRERFGYKVGDFPVCEEASRYVLALPFFGNISQAQIDYVCKRLKEAIRKNKKALF